MEAAGEVCIQGRADPEIDEEAERYERDAGNHFDESSGGFATFSAVSNRSMVF